MNILINNGNLGRMGKTTIAYTLYKVSSMGFKYATNDLDNASIKLEKHIPESELLHFPTGVDIDVDTDDSVIFDFGGKPDSRLLSVASYVDVIIVPVAYQSQSELTLTVQNINALLDRNPNIVIVINNTEVADMPLVKLALAATFPDLEILEISHSKFVRRLANDNMTIFDVAAANKADGTRLQKKLIPQFNKLLDHIEVAH